tara:strand:- start:15351 stop:16184 length:834 start_codon:yes stop_codon:yes gene_type:complete
MGSVVGKILGGEKAKPAQAAPGAKFEPFTYTGLAGTATGTRDGEGFKFEQELTPELQALYEQGLLATSPLLSQYLEQTQAPVPTFDFMGDDLRTREQQILQEQTALLEPELERQRQQLRSDLFGSGRLGLQLSGEAVGAGAGTGMISPDAYGLGLAQSRALAELAPEARRLAATERLQDFGLQSELYNINQAARQQQLANLLSGLGAGMGTFRDVLGIEQGLIGQASGLEQARAAATAGAFQAGTPATGRKPGLFEQMLVAAAGSAGSAYGNKKAGG